MQPIEAFVQPKSMAPLQAVDLALARLQRGAATGLPDPARQLPGESQLVDGGEALEPALRGLRAAILELWDSGGDMQCM